MAKWGEGDPRWIVEHRDDGKNVNGWHWSEVNRLEWSNQRLAELLPGTEAAGAAGWAARVTRVKSVTGEAMLTTRKGGKRFAFYDLKLTLAWEAAPASSADGQAEAEAEAAAGAEEEDGVEKSSGGGGSGGQAPVSGEMTVAEFGSGSDHDDIEVSVTASGGSTSSAEKEAAKKLAQQALWPLVLQRLEQYVKELGES